ncbi:MAG TPA: DUF1836 domain-containing protein [Rectinemataceae bacterium]
MDEITKLALHQYCDVLECKTTADWAQLPDLGLYMDQVITYLERQLDIFVKPGGESSMTPSMINNYVKAKIVPRAEGKKYRQEHIALLLAVFTLKRVLSMQDLVLLLGSSEGKNVRDGGEEGSGAGHGVEEAKGFYERFRRSVELSAKATSAALGNALASSLADGEDSDEESRRLLDERRLRDLALEFSVEASVKSYAAEMLLALANPAGRAAITAATTREKKGQAERRKGKKASS